VLFLNLLYNPNGKENTKQIEAKTIEKIAAVFKDLIQTKNITGTKMANKRMCDLVKYAREKRMPEYMSDLMLSDWYDTIK
jgi:hypothetical protein